MDSSYLYFIARTGACQAGFSCRHGMRIICMIKELVNFPPLISANRNQWGPLGASFMHSRKVLPKQNGSRLRDYSRGYLRFCSSPCFHLGMPSKSQTVLKAAAGAGTHRKITVILSHTFKMDMPDFILGREVLPLVSFRFPVQAHPYDLLLYLKQLLRLPVCGPPSGQV